MASLVEIPEPWTPAQATERIRSIADGQFYLSYKDHATEQMEARGIIVGDVNYVLRNGIVYQNPVEATRKHLWKYAIESKAPNSKNREIRIVLIPDWKVKGFKLITIMWADEPMTTR